MDKSEQYIRMADCEEIQSHNPYPIQVGSWCGDKGRRFLWQGEHVLTYNTEGSAVWLPRQDQILEMIKGEGEVDRSNWEAVILILAVRFKQEREYFEQFDTMEKIWLASLMLDHSKKWTGDKWVLYN